MSFTESNHFSMSFSFSYWNITVKYTATSVENHDIIWKANALPPPRLNNIRCTARNSSHIMRNISK